MADRPFELTDLDIDEWSLVDRPANKGSRFLFWKRADGGPEECATMETIEKVGVIRRLMKTLGVGPADLAQEGEVEVSDTLKRLEELTAEVEKLKTQDGADAVRKAIVDALKSEDPAARLADLEKSVADLEKAATAARIADLEKRLADADAAVEVTKEMDGFRAKLPKAMRPGFDEMSPEEKKKFMASYGKAEKADEPLAKALSTVEKLSEENEKLAARLEKLEGDRELAKTVEDLADVAAIVDPGEFAKDFRELAKASPEAADRLHEKLKAAAERAETGALFGTIGTAGGEAPTATEKIAKAVAKYRDDHPDVSKEAAEAAVLKADPGLYTAYKAELEGGR